MKVSEIIIVADGKQGWVKPYSEEDLIAAKKYKKSIMAVYEGAFLKSGFWKITIKSYFFGIYKELTLEQLRMPL
jgi:hypothetical protein